MGALLPLPSNPHRSWVNTVANPVAVTGFCAVGIKVSLPIPRLFLCTKFIVLNVWAIPVIGTYIPSSWSFIPSSSALGGVGCHLIP